MQSTIQLCFPYYPVSLWVAIITGFNKWYVMSWFSDWCHFSNVKCTFFIFIFFLNPAMRSVWPQVPCVLVWACCDSRWESLGCWSSQSTKRHNFAIWRVVFVQKSSYCVDVHNFSQEVLAYCTKDSSGLTIPLFLVWVVKEGRAIGWNCGVVSASSCCMSDKVKG